MNMNGHGPILVDLSEFAKIQLIAKEIRRFRMGRGVLSPILSRSP